MFPGLARRLAVPLTVALSGAACVINMDADAVTIRDEKRFTVSGQPDISLSTFDGSIEVRSWDRAEVFVEIEKHGPDREAASALEVTATQEGDRIRVDAPKPKVTHHVFGIGNFSSPGVRLIVSVPRKVKLTAHTADGAIAIEHVDGTINLQSNDGSVKGEGLQGDITARTDDGSMRFVDVNGRVVVESGDGSIHVAGRVDNVQARTRDGSIVIEAAEGSAMASDWDVSTGDGSIVFRVPEGFNADIDAHSGDGSVSANVSGLENVRTGDGRESLRGRVGSGGHLLKLRSGDGSIRLLKR
jgi:hypothetical protein